MKNCNACITIAKRVGFELGMLLPTKRENHPAEIVAIGHRDSRVHLLLANEYETILVPLPYACLAFSNPDITLPIKENA